MWLKEGIVWRSKQLHHCNWYNCADDVQFDEWVNACTVETALHTPHPSWPISWNWPGLQLRHSLLSRVRHFSSGQSWMILARMYRSAAGTSSWKKSPTGRSGTVECWFPTGGVSSSRDSSLFQKKKRACSHYDLRAACGQFSFLIGPNKLEENALP